MSNISLSHQVRTFAPQTPLFLETHGGIPIPDPAIRAKRSLSPQAFVGTTSSWTLQSLPSSSDEASSASDRLLQTSLGESALRHSADKKIPIQADATIFPLYDAYQRAFNRPELQAWFRSKGMALSTVMVMPGSVSGRVTRDGVSTVQTFTTHDASGWWQASAKLRAAARELDPEGMGLPYASDDSNDFSRNAILRWYGVLPPANDGDLNRARHDLSLTDWSAPTPEVKEALQSRVQRARSVIGMMDERAHMASILTERAANTPDDQLLTLEGVDVQVSSTSTLALNSNGKAPISDVLRAHDLPLPKTAGELRNIVRWLTASLPPPPPQGNYSDLLSHMSVPGTLSTAEKKVLLQSFGDTTENTMTPLEFMQQVDDSEILGLHTPETLRARADEFLDAVFRSESAVVVGEMTAGNMKYLGASGTPELSRRECTHWAIAVLKLLVDANAPGPSGTLAGYDLYKPDNNGRSLAAVRADIEAHLQQNRRVDAKIAPLVAHLFLAEAAPEFLVRDIPSTLRIGSMEWADLRLGVTFAERQGGAGCSRAMSYAEIMALTRLDARTSEESALLDNYGTDALLDWGLMQGLFSKPAEGRYTPQQHRQAVEAFNAQRQQLIQAVKTFNVPQPTRQASAIVQLQKVFPGLSVPQLKALKVHIADRNEQRNMKPSEPRNRSLVETYMTGDLIADRWMLLAPGEEAPQPAKPKSPYGRAIGLSQTQQAAVNKNVQTLNAKIADLPDVRALLPGEVDAYLSNLKQGLSTTTRRMIANLPLADRRALELGKVELFALREQTDGVPTLEQTPGQIEELRGRKGTLVRCDHKGVISYFEVFPDKMLIIKREDLPEELKLGGTLQNHPKTYGRWAPTITQLQNGAVEPFDFTAYSSNAMPRPKVTSPGVIIDKLGDTLAAAPASAQNSAENFVPNSFSSARTQVIVDRIMQGNFVHHRDSVLKIAQGQLPLEERREISRHNDSILFGMIPFVGALKDLANGKTVEGTRGLVIDTAGFLLGGGLAPAAGGVIKSTKVVVPFGAKAFHALEKGVVVISGIFNPLDGVGDLMVGAAKGLIALPKTLKNGFTVQTASLLGVLGSVEEKMRTFMAVQSGVKKVSKTTSRLGSDVDNGQSESGSAKTQKIDGRPYAINPLSGLPFGTPLDGYQPPRGVDITQQLRV